MIKELDLHGMEKGKIKVFDLPKFQPEIIDHKYLGHLNLTVKPSRETLSKLEEGSSAFIDRYSKRSLVSDLSGSYAEIPLDEPLQIHNYTKNCPKDALEINPVVGCGVSCLYCLVTNGDHTKPLKAYGNYRKYLSRRLDQDDGGPHYFYFSPKTEPFQEATLQTGIAHDILREFIRYFEKNPKSRAKVFMISKAGVDQLLFKDKDDSILDLMSELSDRLIYNTSTSIMPRELTEVLEPRAATVEDRLKAVTMCQECNIAAKSAVVQPIIGPYLTDESIDESFAQLREANINSFKPEALTLCIENLAAIGQLLGHFDKKLEKELYESYLCPENMENRKHKSRIAPDRKSAYETTLKLKSFADKHGLTMNICNWLRSDLNITEQEIPVTHRDTIVGCKPVAIK